MGFTTTVLLGVCIFALMLVHGTSTTYTVSCKANSNCETGLQATYKSESGKTATSCVGT